ncbi:hypothetical protein ACFUIW_07370 [Streptomyces sp. NPDC057245]|uniref:hypothetical protein n=1 Tax=Streptomyces sp. NPDC057245 TaxID=3346065 RepID=UPI0036415056
MRAKFDLPVLLVAVCRSRTTARWAAGPFECRVGPWSSQITRPFVLGPDTVPEITDETLVADQPALATFSAIVHSESRGIDAILNLLAHGMRSFDVATAKYWSEMLEVGLEDTPARDRWRELEKVVISYFPGRGTVFEEAYYDGEAKGKAAGKAEGVLRVLEGRGLAVSDDARARVSDCTDLDRLDDWLDRAGTVERAEELFEGMAEEPEDEPQEKSAAE